MKKTYNVDNIVLVIVRNKRLSCEFDYVHIPEKRIFGIFKHREKIFIDNFFRKRSVENFIKEYNGTHIIQNEKVYEKPSVIITYNNNDTIYKYFDTYQDALDYYNLIIDKIPNKI